MAVQFYVIADRGPIRIKYRAADGFVYDVIRRAVRVKILCARTVAPGEITVEIISLAHRQARCFSYLAIIPHAYRIYVTAARGIERDIINVRLPHGVQYVIAVCGHGKIYYVFAVRILNRADCGFRPALKGPADKRISVCGKFSFRIVNVNRIFRIANGVAARVRGFVKIVFDGISIRLPHGVQSVNTVCRRGKII